MNLQDILTAGIVAFAFGYAAYGLFKLLTPLKSGSPAKCSGCTACSDKNDLIKNIR